MTDQWTDLEAKAVALRDAAGADQIHYALEAFESAANPATILALISEAREAERMRGALERIASGYAGCEDFQDAQAVAAEALAPATGGGE